MFLAFFVISSTSAGEYRCAPPGPAAPGSPAPSGRAPILHAVVLPALLRRKRKGARPSPARSGPRNGAEVGASVMHEWPAVPLWRMCKGDVVHMQTSVPPSVPGSVPRKNDRIQWAMLIF